MCIAGKMRRRRVRDLSIVQNTPNSEERNSEQQTVVGSSNVPETLDEPEEFQSNIMFILHVLTFIIELFVNFNIIIVYHFSAESGGTRRVRGRTLLRDLYDLDPVERVKVSRNTHGQPVGSEARLLAGYLGILARNANIFALEVSGDYIKKALGKRWRDNKSTLKKQYFKKDISLEEKLRNVPPGMLRYQWEDAVRFWNSKKGEVLRISKLLYIVFTIYVIIILLCRTVSELEQAAGKNKNSRTRQGREVLLL
ncbi:hypothetical protein GOBAR_AA27371 [Gossypium barbadense]|uniref:Uncharacterized protein n=1 Tax=Gossypium barbadense TaxID=3634 RepID=A0A2P5WQD9_GOSBA|nr:hypothetical protein GOBAR_AA27371 [Gossypium barbadense]